MSRRVVAALLVPAVLLLSACAAPTPSPTPSTTRTAKPSPTVSPNPNPAATTPAPQAEPAGPPPVDQLVLTPEGLGTLSIGSPIDPAMATFDPHGCRTPENDFLEYADDDPIWEAYIPNYPKFSLMRSGWEYSYYPFEPHHDRADGTLNWLRVQSPDIRTDRGIHIGSTEAEVQAAYPDAAVFEKGDQYRSYNIDGASGRLSIEVTSKDFDASLPITVWTMYLGETSNNLYSIGGGDGGGFCALQV